MVTKYGIINDGCLVEELDAAVMENRGSHRMIITVSEPERSANILAGMIPPQDIFIDGPRVIVNAHFENSAQFNKLLVENGIWVSSLELKAESTEEYFMNLTGGLR